MLYYNGDATLRKASISQMMHRESIPSREMKRVVARPYAQRSLKARSSQARFMVEMYQSPRLSRDPKTAECFSGLSFGS